MKAIWVVIWLAYCVFLKGNTLEICTTCTYPDIKSAYESSSDGDTLLIKSGNYPIDQWKIDKALTILGENSPILSSLSGKEIITVLSNDVVIKGLILEGVQTSYLTENAALRVKNSRDFLIENNEIRNCFFAIYLERSHSGIVRNNTITGNATTEAESGNGVHAWYCNHLSIYDNKISSHRDGIYFEFVDSSSIADNHSHHNLRYGLHFMFSNDDSYKNNIIENNGVGVAVMFSRRIDMIQNTFRYNWGPAAYGLLLKEIYDAQITDNMFVENTVGIFVEGSNRIQYKRNEFRGNGWAFRFSGGCDANEIRENNFLNNSIDLEVNSSLQNNIFEGNYWQNYNGYDLDRDGIGDVPYYPVKLFSYLYQMVPESIILMRSLLVDMINYAEKISPVFTPKDVMDKYPKMNYIK